MFRTTVNAIGTAHTIGQWTARIVTINGDAASAGRWADGHSIGTDDHWSAY